MGLTLLQLWPWGWISPYYSSGHGDGSHLTTALAMGMDLTLLQLWPWGWISPYYSSGHGDGSHLTTALAMGMDLTLLQLWPYIAGFHLLEGAGGEGSFPPNVLTINTLALCFFCALVIDTQKWAQKLCMLHIQLIFAHNLPPPPPPPPPNKNPR